MLNLESNNLVFMFNGAEKRLRFPTVREWDAYAKKVANKENEVGEVISFLCSLGLDEKTADLLEAAHLEAILNELSAPKKK